MEKYREAWLPHLKDTVPYSAYGAGTCMYVIALEGWRRGLDLKFIMRSGTNLLNSVGFTLSDGETEHTFFGSRGDYVSMQARRICASKGLTNKCLADANVSVPKGQAFGVKADNKEIIDYATSLGYPVVLKPNGSEGGIGVITNIKTEEEMTRSVKRVRDVLGHKPVIVEKHFFGEDFRVYVLDGKVIGAFHRRAQSVVGDGKSNIVQLLEQKNKERMRSPFLAKKKIKIDKAMLAYLEERGLNQLYIPKDGERVFLRRNGEFFGERDSVNATHLLSEEMEQVAISAVDAIPGLPHGGLDMLIDLEKNQGIVNEVNSRAQISNHVFPVEGDAIDIPKYIIDYYFPETKNRKLTNVLYHFEYKHVIEGYEEGVATEIKIPPMPVGHKVSKGFIVTGKNIGETYWKWLQKKVKPLNLHGFIKEMSPDTISVVVSGDEKDVTTFENAIRKSPKIRIINGVLVNEYNGPIRIGFELKSI